MPNSHHIPRLIGTTWGDPSSTSTYSGVPYHLFNELDKHHFLVGRANTKLSSGIDVFRGAIDFRRSIKACSPKRNSFWRYYPESIALLSKRLQNILATQPKHDAVVQFGVAGLPDQQTKLIAHVEITIETAACSPTFSKDYGFDRFDARLLAKVIEGERFFLQQCSLVWTNTPWTAEGIIKQGVPRERIWIRPPACGMSDPGPIIRDWSTPHLLFIGKVWENKGGPLVLDAFRILRKRWPHSTLTVIGCSPHVTEPGVALLGYLDKSNPRQAQLFSNAFRQATIFCMPSQWESVGIVYMEAALFGLPVVMLKGQGREQVFPDNMCLILEQPDSRLLADRLIEVSERPEILDSMGQAGRAFVREQHTWCAFCTHFLARLRQL